MGYQIPVKYYQGNLAFGDRDAWAYYELPGFYYDFLSSDKKIQKMLNQSIAVMGVKVELHMLAIPVKQEISGMGRAYEKLISGPLKEEGISHNRQVTEVLERKYGSSHKFRFYLGVKLAPYEAGNWKESLQAGFQAFKKSLYQYSDLYIVTEKEIGQYVRIEKQVYQRLNRYLRVERAGEGAIPFLIARNFTRGIEKAIPEGMEVSYQVQDGKRLVEGAEVKRLCEGLVDDTSMDFLKVMNNGEARYLAFLCVSYFAYESEAVGNEFIYFLQELDFPVDLSIRARIKDNQSARSTVRGKKEGVEAEIRFAEESGKSPSQEAIEGEEGLYNLEYDLRKSRKPLLEMSVVFCVYADSEEEMRTRASVLKEEYKSMFEMVLEQPHGDQFLLFHEFLPGAGLTVTDYLHVAEPNFLASGMFGATKELGDPVGFPIGTTGVNDRIVYLNPKLAAQGQRGTVTNSLSIAVVGSVGGGKSVTVNLISYWIVLSGGKVLILDPKGERIKWLECLPELGDQLNIVTLLSNEEYRGLLDPWNIMEGKEAEALALSVLTTLLGGMSRDPRFKVITKAVKEVGQGERPCMKAVVDYLLESGEKTYVEVGEDIQAFYDISFAVLLFGDGKPVKTIDLEASMNVLQIQNMMLPNRDVKPEDYTIENVLSVALLAPITAFAEKFIRGDRSVLKVFVSEEAWATLASSQGKQISNKLSREGRALNAGIYYVSQDVGVLEGAIKDNIGMKFAFRCKDEEEVAKVLAFFDMEKTEENVEILKTLENGQCLFQDIRGHIGVLNVDPVFQDLFEAFDTRPPMEVSG